VAAWLGFATEDTKFAFRYLELEQLSRDILKSVQGLPGSERVIATLRPLRHMEPPGDALRALCRRDYWLRAWIRQEILLAKDIRGGMSATWDAFGVKGMAANLRDIEDIPESRFVRDFFFYRAKLNNEKPKTLKQARWDLVMSSPAALSRPRNE
jgi:hypothetical protein